MGGITIKQVNAMEPGTKVLADTGIYLRRNTDNTVTAWCRIKKEGKSIDVKAGAEPLPVTKGGLDELLTLAQQTRRVEVKRKPVPAPMAATMLTSASPVSAVWADMLERITLSGKWTDGTRKTSLDRVKRYLEPSTLWKLPIGEVQPLHITNLLQPMARTPDQQKKIRGLLSLVMMHGIGAGLRVDNPAQAAGAVLRVTTKATRAKHFPTITVWSELRTIYRRIQTLDSKAVTRTALQLQALTCQRTGEVLRAEWSEFDLDAGLWTIPRARMKMKDPGRGDHLVPLSTQAVQLLQTLKPSGQYLFPGRSGEEPTSENTLPQALRRDLGLADQFVPHSWRSALRTLAASAEDADGRPLFSESWLESVLDHGKADAVQAAYDRGKHTAGARRALQWWADSLTGAA